MKNFKSHFKFNKQERSGIFFLLLFIVLLQVAYVTYRAFSMDDVSVNGFLQDSETQAQIDALKAKAQQKDTVKLYAFNPNFITDYKGYVLGMSVEEIDRLHAFRARNKYVNSPEAFQEVTQISDSLLAVMVPYFKFPEWTTKQGDSKNNLKKRRHIPSSKIDLVKKDLNTATADELRVVSGIGVKLSARIIKFRDRLGGFLVAEQLYDVYGLEDEVVERALQRFTVVDIPAIEKININNATVEMLTELVYIQRKVAIGIVNYRNLNGSIDSFDELSKIENFPFEKIDRIALYLSLKK